MGELITRSDAQLITTLLDTGDPRDTQRALQLLAWNSHAGRMPATMLWHRVVASLHLLYTSSDVKVRRWSYVATCFLQPKPRANSGYRTIIQALENCTQRTETDPENRLWASAATFATLDATEVVQHLQRCPTEFRAAQLQLAYRLTHAVPITALGSIETFFVKSPCDDISALWHALLFGYHTPANSPLPKDAVRTVANLTLHSNPEVAEYSVWSLFHNRCGRPEHLPQTVDTYMMQPASVRRWVYRLIAKDHDLSPAARNVVEDAIYHERDPAAQEGLALAIEHHRPDTAFQRSVMAWYISDPTPTVRRALLRHFARHAEHSDDYVDLLREALLFEPASPKIRSVVRSTIYAVASPATIKLLEPKRQPTTLRVENTFMQISRSIVNLGTMGNATINSIEALGAASTPHSADIATSLRELIDKVAVDTQLTPEQREEIFEYVTRLSRAATNPTGETDGKSSLRALAGLARELPAYLPTAQFILEVVDKVRGWLS